MDRAANLLAETMTAGTAKKTPAELEQAIDLLGASINVSADAESFTISGSTLARNWPQTMALVEEILLEPRYDPQEFEIARQGVRSALIQQQSSPAAIAGDVFNRLLYGDHILAKNPLGTPAVIERLAISDLRAYHDRALAPSLAAFHVAGSEKPSAIPSALMPRNCGQSTPGVGAPGAAPELKLRPTSAVPLSDVGRSFSSGVAAVTIANAASARRRVMAASRSSGAPPRCRR